MFSISQKENQFPTTNTLKFLPPMPMIRKLKDIFIGYNQEKQHQAGKVEINRLNSSYVTLHKSFNFLEPQFPPLQNGKGA